MRCVATGFAIPFIGQPNQIFTLLPPASHGYCWNESKTDQVTLGRVDVRNAVILLDL